MGGYEEMKTAPRVTAAVILFIAVMAGLWLLGIFG